MRNTIRSAESVSECVRQANRPTKTALSETFVSKTNLYNVRTQNETTPSY